MDRLRCDTRGFVGCRCKLLVLLSTLLLVARRGVQQKADKQEATVGVRGVGRDD